MKKRSLLPVLLVGILVACGSGEKKTKDTPNTDTTKTDSTSTTNTSTDNVQPQTKDYAYFLNLFKNPNIAGVQLSQNYINDDSKAMQANVNHKVTNASEAGYDEVRFATINPKQYMGEQKEKYENFTKESFDYFQNLDKSQKKVKVQEYASNGTTFYYCTRKDNKGSFGSKDYHSMTMQAKVGDLIIQTILVVNDLKSDMVKPEAELKKIADILAK